MHGTDRVIESHRCFHWLRAAPRQACAQERRESRRNRPSPIRARRPGPPVPIRPAARAQDPRAPHTRVATRNAISRDAHEVRQIARSLLRIVLDVVTALHVARGALARAGTGR